ncbi:unnamed protein product [Urochloa humidicola]
MEQALAAGFLPSAARSDSAAFLLTGAGSRAAAFAPARMACLPAQWSSASTSTSTRGATTRSSSSVAGNLTACRCSYSYAVPSSAAAGKLSLICGSTSKSSAAGYLATCCCACSCAGPSSSAAGNLNISHRSSSSAACSSSPSGNSLQVLVVSVSASSAKPCYYSTGSSSSSAFSLQFAGAASSSEEETVFARVFAFPSVASSSAFSLQFAGAASSSEEEALFAHVFAFPYAPSISAFSLQFAGAASSSEEETLSARVFAFPCASSSSSVRLQFMGTASSSEAELLLAGCLAFHCATISAVESSARESPPMCFAIFPKSGDRGLRVDIDTSAAGRGPRFFVAREASSEKAAAGCSAIESPFARFLVVFSDGSSSSAGFSAPSRAAVVSFAGAKSPSPDANSCSRDFSLLSGASRRPCSSTDAYLVPIPVPDPLTAFSSLPLSRRTNYCILSGAAGSWRDKARKRYDCRCYAVSKDAKEMSLGLDGFRLPLDMSLDWENFARVCLLCSLLQRAGYFSLPPPSQTTVQVPKKDWKKDWKDWLNRMVRAVLLVCCLYAGYSAATGDRRKVDLVSVIDNIMKAYKIIDEVAKLIFW